MRVLLYLLLILVATAMTIGAALLIVFQFHAAAHGLRIAVAFTVPFLVMGPVSVGAFSGYYDHRSSPEGRRYLNWVLLVVAAVDVVAAVCIVLAALSAQAPIWVPVLFIGAGAVLLAVARPLGAAFRRTESPIADEHDRVLPDGVALRRKTRVIVVTFVVSAVVATIGVAVLSTIGPTRGKDLLQIVFLAGQLTFTATALACTAVSLPISRALRDAGGRDIGRLRRYAKVVLRGKDVPLDEADRHGALEYARIVPVSLQFQLAFTGLLYTAITFQFVSSAVQGRLGVFPLVFLALLAAVLVYAVPLSLRRIRRARQYVADHGESRGATSAAGAQVAP